MDAEIKQHLDELGKNYNEVLQLHKTFKETVEAQGKRDAVFEETLKRATEDVAKIHEQCTKQFDELATKLNRVATEVPDSKEINEEKKDAAEFTRVALIRKGGLQIGQDLPEGYTENYRQYSKALPMYLRFGEQSHRVDQKALSLGSDQDGGFFVRPVWSARIITKIFETSPIRQFASIETVSGPELKYAVDVDEATTGWVSEQAARNVTNTPQVKEKSIVAQEQYALPKATQTILEDAGIDVEAWLMGKVADKFARVENTAFVNGTGIGQPRGLLTYPNGTSWGQVEQVGSGSSGAFTATGLVDIVSSLKEPYHPNARWLIQRASIAPIMLLQDGDGRYIFQPIFTLGYNNTPLLGYPITYAADMPAVGAGALAALFGDLKTAYTIVDRIGLSILRDPFSYKPFIGFYVRKRVGGDVLNFEAYKLHVLT